MLCLQKIYFDMLTADLQRRRAARLSPGHNSSEDGIKRQKQGEHSTGAIRGLFAAKAQ
jgi:hypothetical protein